MPLSIQTFGCRLNTYESEVMRAHAQAAGLQNAILFNTCAVTAEAERQARQAIRRARRENPNAKIIVTGCSAQVHPQSYAAMPEVDLVIGNEEKLKAEAYEWIQEKNSPPLEGGQLRPSPKDAGRSGRGTKNAFNTPHGSPVARPLPLKGGADFLEKTLVNDIMSVHETVSHMVSAFEGHTRAFVQVQNGCDHRCTFCIIPYGRGNSRSVPVGEIVTQVRNLVVEQGYKEVVLTGVDISDYGKDLPGAPTLGQMARRLLALVPEITRLRLSSIDAVEVDDDLYRLIAEEPRLMPHLHISLQAGDDMILKRMKRRHLRKDAVEFCARVRRLRPDMVFGADFIAGFPTETEAMFQSTLDIVDECGLTYLHVFAYSQREGTPAARMPQVPRPVRKERAARLREKGKAAEEAFYASHVGREVELLVEDGAQARTEHFALAQVGPELRRGSLVRTKVVAVENERLQVMVP